LEKYHHNFIRGWIWEDAYYTPLPFKRTGPGQAKDGLPKFDLTQYEQAFFNQIRQRAIEAGKRGMYIGIMLFEGWSIEDKKGARKASPWLRHPFHAANNINGIDGDPNGDGQGFEVHMLDVPAVTALQEAYVRKFIDELNDLDNIIWEISNESHADSVQWHYHMIRFIKTYQATKPKQHLVWMNAYAITNADLYNSPADVVSPSNKDKTDYRGNPPVATGKQIIVSDTDHLWGVGGDVAWVWKSFLRGYHPIFMDPLHGISWAMNKKWRVGDPKWVPIRQAMGHTLLYAEKMNLARMLPLNGLSSTTYCLAEPGAQYLVYQPKGETAFTVRLKAGTYAYEWFNVNTGQVADKGTVNCSEGACEFNAPFDSQAVLYLTRQP